MSYPQDKYKLSTGIGRIGLKPGTLSHKAYKKGIEAFDAGLGEDVCPYVTGKVQMLRSWWMVGYHELDNKKLTSIRESS